MRIIVAPDKFKGSLTAQQAADAICGGFVAELPDASLHCLPLADGGEGTTEVFLHALGGEIIECETQDALGRPVRSRYGWTPGLRQAVIEMAAASGLALIPNETRDPRHASTRGTGEMILHAARLGAERIVVGLGGSATNDAGAGLAAALGFRFLDGNGAEVDPVPANFPRIVRIEQPPEGHRPQILALSDVRSLLLGERGASRLFGPQKGATPAQVDELESALTGFADLVTRELGCDFRETPGAGAAGGLGFGLLSFVNATMEPGFEAFARLTDLENLVAGCDLVITGEGCLDSTTLEGKGPGSIARLARDLGKPVIAFAGTMKDEATLGRHFDLCIGLANRPMTAEASLADAAPLLRDAACRVARLIRISKLL